MPYSLQPAESSHTQEREGLVPAAHQFLVPWNTVGRLPKPTTNNNKATGPTKDNESSMAQTGFAVTPPPPAAAASYVTTVTPQPLALTATTGAITAD